MPFRAFGDSDRRLQGDPREEDPEFQCPFGHSGILTGNPGPGGWAAVLSFNALSGIRGF